MKNFLQTLILLTFGCGLTYCNNKSQISDFKEQSHAKSALPNYALVFPNDKVNRIDIQIDAEKWAEMQADLKLNIGTGSRQMPPPPKRKIATSSKMQGGISEKNSNRMPLDAAYQGKQSKVRHSKGDRRMGPPPGARPGGSEYEPVWEYCNVYFNNQEWNSVGIRFKGNSSLRTTYQKGIKKLSFKLDFDQFEDEFPEIKNQRFYGFKQLNLKNNYDDKSFIREKVAADLFADFGLITAKTSFCKLFVDFGEGPKYFGLYTLVEEVDDTVIKTNFSKKNGNLYKPDGPAATFADGSFNNKSMNEKNNPKAKDFSDVQNLNTILNSSLRLENHELWKAQLASIFDVPVFLKWLAANTVIQNWDSYGRSFHNYYLYHNPESKKLEWISWDNNEAFQNGKMGGALSLSLNEVGEQWPLIRYIMDDEEWANDYKSYISTFTHDVFNTDKMISNYTNYQQCLSNCVVGEQGETSEYTFLQGETDFNGAIDFLKQQAMDRKMVVQEFLGKNNE